MRQFQERRKDAPMLAAENLQNQDFVLVIEGREPCGVARREVRIGVHHMVKLTLNSCAQLFGGIQVRCSAGKTMLAPARYSAAIFCTLRTPVKFSAPNLTSSQYISGRKIGVLAY